MFVSCWAMILDVLRSVKTDTQTYQSLYGIMCLLTKKRLMKKPQNALRILLTYGAASFVKGFSTDVIAKLIQKLEHS